MTIIGAHWTSIADCSAGRQPLVESSQQQEVVTKRTILLDYRSIPSFRRWITAFGNRHILTGSACLWSLVLGKIIPAFSAGLFTARLALFNEPTSVLYNVSYDESSVSLLGIDMNAILNTVSATDVFGGSALPWTLDQYAFTPFYHAPAQETGIPNATHLTANTSAYSASLECLVIPPSQFSIRVGKYKNTSRGTQAELTLTSQDRGCRVEDIFTVYDEHETTILKVGSADCGVDASFSRILFTYGIPDRTSPTLLSNATFVSCLSKYTVAHGDLILQMQGESLATPKIVSFEPAHITQRDKAHVQWRLFERNVLNTFNYDILSKWETIQFGNLVLYISGRRQGATDVTNKAILHLQPDELVAAIQAVFASVYRTTIAMHAFFPLDQPILSTTAQLEISRTRLFVVPWVAGIVLFALAVGIVLSCMTVHSVHQNQAMLFKEPKNLLYIAIDAYKSAAFDGKFTESTASKLTMDMKWRMDDSSRPQEYVPVNISND